MLKIEKILIPTDFSDSGRPAVARGADLAKQLGAEVHLLHVALLADAAPVYPVFNLPSDTEKIYKQLHEASEAKLDALVKELDISAVKKVLRHASAAAPVILRYAEEEQLDLIAMGSHGRRGARHFLLGSVAEEVVRQARCPVATYRSNVDEKPRRPEKILAAIDFSEHSERVVAYAREFGALYHANVDFVHVVPQPNFPVFYEFGSGTEIYANLTEVRDKGHRALEELVQEAEVGDVDFALHVLHGRPEDELLRFATDHSSDLIVVATHGLTGLSHLLLGSVAERVLRQAECPVLTVPPLAKALMAGKTA